MHSLTAYPLMQEHNTKKPWLALKHAPLKPVTIFWLESTSVFLDCISPGRRHCVVFLAETLYSHGASHYPSV